MKIPQRNFYRILICIALPGLLLAGSIALNIPGLRLPRVLETRLYVFQAPDQDETCDSAAMYRHSGFPFAVYVFEQQDKPCTQIESANYLAAVLDFLIFFYATYWLVLKKYDRQPAG